MTSIKNLLKKVTHCTFYISIGVLSLGCSPQQSDTPAATDTPPAESFIRIDSITPDAEVLAMISPMKAQLDSQMNQVLAHTTLPLTKKRPEGTLGNLMCDAVYEMTKIYSKQEIDFVSLNYGGIRIKELAAGPITVGEVYEMMPFENRIAILTLSGKEVIEFVQYMVQGGGSPVSKSIKVVAADHGLGFDIYIKDQQIELKKNYKVVVNDYIANGGDNSDFLIGKPREDLPNKIRDAIIDYLKRQKEPLALTLEGRMIGE